MRLSRLILQVSRYFFSNSTSKSQIWNPIIFYLDHTNTLCSAGDSLDETRSIIDRNIARLEESNRALKSRRNELSPISRLPVELLCNMFKFSESQARRPESWTNFSQVSQHWRTYHYTLSKPRTYNES